MKKFSIILILILSCFSYAFGQAQIDHRLNNLMSSSQAIEVIVVFEGNQPPTAANVQLLNQAGITQGYTLNSLPMAAVLATPSSINILSNQADVKAIYLNRQIELENHEANSLTGVDKARTEPQFIAANGGLPLTGKGIGVLVNDSGIDGTHPDLSYPSHVVQNVTAAANLNSLSSILPYTPIEDVANTDATGGHGTHVAGIVGATGAASQGLYEGVAPGADIIGYGSGLALFLLDVVSGFDYALTHQIQYNIRVITNSWGTTGDAGTDVDPFDPINVATKKCVDRNIVVVFSAGNSGSGSSTITGNYKKAPWVICVAAGDKQGRLADFSSRGTKDNGGSFSYQGETFSWEDRPTITSPGVNIVSTRTASPVGLLNTAEDTAFVEPAYLAFYTTLDGTSMAAPHVAGIVALMLEADPTLTPADVKEIIQQTATNIPGREKWEVGAGYVNAYAAIEKVMNAQADYGATLNAFSTFNSTANNQIQTQTFPITYTPVVGGSNTATFSVSSGTTVLEAQTEAPGLFGLTGNLANLILLSPSGREFRSGIPVTFSLSTGRSVAVADPEPGTWTVRMEGLNGVGLPETFEVDVLQHNITSFNGVNDISGHPAESAIKLALSRRMLDGKNGKFRPNSALRRIELAQYLMMGQGIRQNVNSYASFPYIDVDAKDRALVSSVMSTGAAIRDIDQDQNPVMMASPTRFKPGSFLRRFELAYSMVQSLGLQDYAQSLGQDPISVEVNGDEIILDDEQQVPQDMRGYVQAALNLKLINVHFELLQGPFDLFPTLHASFKPLDVVRRGEFAVIATRTFEEWPNPSQLAARKAATENSLLSLKSYPNPSQGRLWVDFETREDQQVRLDLLNVQGQLVKTLSNEPMPRGIHKLKVSTSDLPSGLYLLRLKSGENTSTQRIAVSAQ